MRLHIKPGGNGNKKRSWSSWFICDVWRRKEKWTLDPTVTRLDLFKMLMLRCIALCLTVRPLRCFVQNLRDCKCGGNLLLYVCMNTIQVLKNDFIFVVAGGSSNLIFCKNYNTVKTLQQYSAIRPVLYIIHSLSLVV